MKKSALRVVCSLLFVFLLCGTVHADVYTNTVNFTGSSLWVGLPPELESGVLLNGENKNYSWQHAVTSNFSVPYDTVNSATLTISGWGIGGGNDYVYAESALQGVLTGDSSTTLRWLWTETNSEFDLADVFLTWTAGDPLDVRLNYTDNRFLHGGFLLTQSVFSLNYENGEAPAVPIPGTLLMLGTGLIGLLGIRRRFAAR